MKALGKFIPFAACLLSGATMADTMYTAEGAFPLPPQSSQQIQQPENTQKPAMQIFSENASGTKQKTIIDDHGNLKVVEREVKPGPQQVAQAAAGSELGTTGQQGIASQLTQPQGPAPTAPQAAPQPMQGQSQAGETITNRGVAPQQGGMTEPSQMQSGQGQPLPPSPASSPVPQGQLQGQILSPQQPGQMQPSQTQPAQMQRQPQQQQPMQGGSQAGAPR